MANLSLEDKKLITDMCNRDSKRRYAMLGRLQADCKYYLDYGNRRASCLWALDEVLHIELMKALYNSFSDNEKPQYISFDEILQFEKQMCK